MTSLPLKDESVDVVTLRSVVIYVPEKQRAFDEIFRVLKPGGRLSLLVPTIKALDRALSPPSGSASKHGCVRTRKQATACGAWRTATSSQRSSSIRTTSA